MTIRSVVLSAVLLAAAALSHALEVKPYTAAALAEAQQAKQPVAVLFHADWCPTCRAQQQVLNTLKTEAGLDLTLLVANYDTEKDLKKRFNVRGQSTLVVLNGQEERHRSMGTTSADAIRSALKSAL